MAPGYGPYVRFAILTGLRQAEQFRLEWAHVDLERGFLILPMTKAGEVQYVLLNEEAKEILQGWTPGSGPDGFPQVRTPHPRSSLGHSGRN